jgi:carboxyl-terminal processing protease
MAQPETVWLTGHHRDIGLPRLSGQTAPRSLCPAASIMLQFGPLRGRHPAPAPRTSRAQCGVAVAIRHHTAMRELSRIVIFFAASIAAMLLAFGAGFVTANRVPGALGSREEMLARISDAIDGRSVQPTTAASATLEAAAVATPTSGEPADFGIFWQAYDRLKSDAYGAMPDDKEITYGAIRGSLRSLDDPFTVFTDPVVTEVQRPELDSAFEGIGAYVSSNAAGQLIIQTPMRGQPAERAGVMAGDIVLKVDDTDISGMDVEDAVLLIRGPKGTTVRLTILRKGIPQPMVIPVVRDRIDIPSVNDVRLLDDLGAPQVGYLQLTMFASETDAELRSAIDELRGKGAKALVLDLRNDPGGFLNTAIEVASEFIDEGVIVYQEDKVGHRIAENAKSGGHALDVPLVVLINKGSASAAEIVAGAIRDHDRGRLVGQTTYGKGSVQNVHDLADGSQVRITVAVWLTPDGSLIHRRGITPDVEVDLTAQDVEAGRDPQLERAVQEATKLLGSP